MIQNSKGIKNVHWKFSLHPILLQPPSFISWKQCHSFLYFYFWLYHVACEILVAWPGIKPKPSAVTTGSPNCWTVGKSLSVVLWGFFQRDFMRHIQGGSMVKNTPTNAGDVGSIPGLGRSPEEGNGNPLQYSCLGNPMGRGAWLATVLGVAKELDTT